MLSLSRMSSYFMSLESYLEDCSFITLSNSSACLTVLSMRAYISLLRFFEMVPMSVIMLASIKVSIIGNCICGSSLSIFISSFSARNNSSSNDCRNFSHNRNFNFLDFAYSDGHRRNCHVSPNPNDYSLAYSCGVKRCNLHC